MLRDIMTHDVVVVPPEMPLAELAELFAARHIGGVPVVSGREVVGVVSAADMLNLAASAMIPPAREAPSDDDEVWGGTDDLSVLDEETLPAGFFSGDWDIGSDDLEHLWKEDLAVANNALRESTVADIMTTEVLSMPPRTSVSTAAAFMRRNGVHRVLVMDGSDLQGIVSSMDIVKAVAERRIGSPAPMSAREAEFDSGWSHEPIVPEADPYPVRSLAGRATPARGIDLPAEGTS